MTCREASVASAHSGVGSQTITDPDNGFNERWMTKLAAQPTDGDSDSVAERIGVRIPNVLEKLFSTHRRAIRNEESLQHAEFLASQADGQAGSSHSVPGAIHRQIPPVQNRRHARTAPAQRPDPSHQLA